MQRTQTGPWIYWNIPFLFKNVNAVWAKGNGKTYRSIDGMNTYIYGIKFSKKIYSDKITGFSREATRLGEFLSNNTSKIEDKIVYTIFKAYNLFLTPEQKNIQ